MALRIQSTPNVINHDTPLRCDILLLLGLEGGARGEKKGGFLGRSQQMLRRNERELGTFSLTVVCALNIIIMMLLAPFPRPLHPSTAIIHTHDTNYPHVSPDLVAWTTMILSLLLCYYFPTGSYYVLLSVVVLMLRILLPQHRSSTIV